MRKTSKKSIRILAILWTILALLWTLVAVLRLSDPNVSGGLKVLSMAVMAGTLTAAMMHWYRYTHYEDDEY